MKLMQTFDGLTKAQKILVTVIIGIILYSASATLSYSAFSNVRGGGLTLNRQQIAQSLPGPSNAVEEETNEPKTETCPLNGALHTKTARASWEKRRPLAVMIENHTEARPQSGLSYADVVYEAVAEGGITRFMGVFYCNLKDVQVGPVRSARTYFIDWLSEYDALYAHVGGANALGPADALGQIIKYKIKDLNQFSIGFPVFWRDYQRLGHAVATEHTMYSTTQKLWEVGAKRGWTATDSAGISWDENFVPWKFKKDVPGGKVGDIKVNFWSSMGGYNVEWKYDSQSNTYKRQNAGEAHIDFDNKQQLAPKVVVVQFERESHANDDYPGNVHLLYGTLGSGKALVFQDGQVTEGKWVKSSRLARSKYVDSKGQEVSFDRGQIWIQTVPEGSEVSY